MNTSWNNISQYEIWYIAKESIDLHRYSWCIWCDSLFGKSAIFSRKKDAIRELAFLNKIYHDKYEFRIIKLTRKSI